jgi:hypothetical protein
MRVCIKLKRYILYTHPVLPAHYGFDVRLLIFYRARTHFIYVHPCVSSNASDSKNKNYDRDFRRILSR